MAHHRTVMVCIERTKRQIRLMEANGASREKIDAELKRLRLMRKALPWYQ